VWWHVYIYIHISVNLGSLPADLKEGSGGKERKPLRLTKSVIASPWTASERMKNLNLKPLHGCEEQLMPKSEEPGPVSLTAAASQPPPAAQTRSASELVKRGIIMCELVKRGIITKWIWVPTKYVCSILWTIKYNLRRWFTCIFFNMCARRAPGCAPGARLAHIFTESTGCLIWHSFYQICRNTKRYMVLSINSFLL
jgi:hypothetical protein